MNRRSFLSALIPAAVALSDPERLIWTPTKTIFIPPAPKLAAIIESAFRVGDVVTFSGYFAMNPRTGKFTDHLRQFIVTDVANDGAVFIPSLRNI